MNINLIGLEDGLTVLCVGFFTVFLFLGILIFAMNVMGKLVKYLNKVFPAAVPAGAAVKKQSTGADEEIAIAIASVLMKKYMTK